MSNNHKEHLCIASDLCFIVNEGKAIIVTGSEDNVLTLEDLGGISEWLAEAWEAVAGEQYKPVNISERGYVAQDSILIEDAVEIASRMDRHVGIKKRAAVLPLFTDKLERDCE